MRVVLGLLGALACVACSAPRPPFDTREQGAAAQRPPNVVVILTDDQGWADVGVQGAEGFATPHLDRMAEGGLLLTHFYAAQATCSASRAALLTGCYAARVDVPGAYGPLEPRGLHPREETIAEVLARVGYATGMVGKWHLGRAPELLPTRQGFQEYYGLPYSNDMWPADHAGNELPAGHRKRAFGPLPVLEGETVVDEVRTMGDQSRLTRRYTERAVQFIEENASEPFFLYVAHSMPHVPLGAAPRFQGSSATPYGDVIQEIDDSVGQVLAALERAGVRDETLVVFTSDNGPWLNYGDHAGSAGPLRSGKGTSFEGGVRVPCIVSWPGHIAPGRVDARMACTIDLLPTFAELAGAPLPSLPIDGVSLVPLLDGAPDTVRDELVFYFPARGGLQLQAVRKRRWKLHLPHRYRKYEGFEPGSGGRAGHVESGETGLELYDLEADPGESRDIAADHPDVVERLLLIAEQARVELGDVGRRGRGVRAAAYLR